MVSQERIRHFTDRIWKWYSLHKRLLPWRDLWNEPEGPRAYKVFLSEVMLQQTQVPRVVILFPRFLERFPTIRDLALASSKDVILAWRGMGYNRRALMLRDAARMIVDKYLKIQEHKRVTPSVVEERHGCHGSTTLTMTRVHHDNRFPQSMEDLLEIPGIGPYTAAAIRNFAFNIPTPCLDTNIRRVLHREFFGPENPDGTWTKTDRELLVLASDVLDFVMAHPGSSPVDTAGHRYPATDWHHALMDYGSLVEKAKKIPRDALREPGRQVGRRFIPNRIFRGKIIEELRKEPLGLSVAGMGERICTDWDQKIHHEWLMGIIEKLKKDALVMQKGKRYLLRE